MQRLGDITDSHRIPGIMARAFAGVSAIVLVSSALFGQAAPTPPAFDIVDVRVSPHGVNPVMTGGVLRGDRYVLRQANMVDLIAAAYGIDDERVLGGPSWLEHDRFDVIAKAPPGTPETIRLMLQQ